MTELPAAATMIVPEGQVTTVAYYDQDRFLIHSLSFEPGDHTVPLWPGAAYWQVVQTVAVRRPQPEATTVVLTNPASEEEMALRVVRLITQYKRRHGQNFT